MSLFLLIQNKDCHFVILMLYHVFFVIIKIACSWTQILTEFGCMSCQLQSWIYHLTNSTNGEILNNTSLCILFSGRYTRQVYVWNIVFLRKKYPVSYVLSLYCTIGRGQCMCPVHGCSIGWKSQRASLAHVRCKTITVK